MAEKFTYSGDPEASAVDAVRFTIGDTDCRDPILLDKEIEYLLKLYCQSVLQASIRACEMAMAKFSRMVDESVGSVRISFSQKSKGYQVLINQLRQRLAIEGIQPFAGGISKTQKATQVQDQDRVVPDFTKHMMENEQIAPWVTNANGNRNDQNEPDV